MRSLRLIILARSGAVPVLAAAVLLPACEPNDEPIRTDSRVIGGGAAGQGDGGQGGSGAGQGGAGQGGQGGGSGQGGSFMLPAAGKAGADTGPCPPPGVQEIFTVPLPPEGVPAEPGQICSVSVEPVKSGRAAHVTLTKVGSDWSFKESTGFCSIDPEIASRVLGEPVLEVVDWTSSALGQMKFSALEKQPGGYSFQALLADNIGLSTGYARLTVRISLLLDCGPEGGGTRLVHATTDIHVCDDQLGQMWVSSGDVCTVCQVIAEMAPSPIVPERGNDLLPLGQVLRLRLVEVARVSGTVVLLAENDGGEGLTYEWQASGGRLEQLAPDLVAWTVEPGEKSSFVHVAVHGPACAAVASFSFNLDGESMRRTIFDGRSVDAGQGVLA